MKITRHQLIKIVKEEMSSVLQETAATDRMADDALRSIDTAVVETHELLPDEAQWIFEKNLENRIRKHLDQWRADRLFTDLDERELTKPEKKEKERIVKGMKDDKKDFKKRYGKDAESVMYATATKIAKDEE
jgi:hypothetical protein